MQGHVDKDLCVACGMCVQACPEAFSLVDGCAKGEREIPPEVLDDAWQVMEDCPAGAIEIR